LVALNRLAQRIEVAFAEAFVVLAQDELEEYRPRQRLAEDLQQLSPDLSDGEVSIRTRRILGSAGSDRQCERRATGPRCCERSAVEVGKSRAERKTA